MVNNVLLPQDGFILRKSVIDQSGVTSVDLDNIFVIKTYNN